MIKKRTAYRILPEDFLFTPLSEETLNLIPWDMIQEFRAFVFSRENNEIKIAAINPDDENLHRYIANLFGDVEVEWLQATEKEVEYVLNTLRKNDKDIFAKEMDILKEQAKTLGDNTTFIKMVDNIINHGFWKRASDIHIEPGRDSTEVRFRIDGSLHTLVEIPSDMHNSLVSRLKVLANLKIDEFRRPQDGRIEPEEFPEASLRISTMPTLFGEKVVLRILDDSTKNLTIENMGFSEKHQRILLRNIHKPFGMIITSGPTGSGKTTTLYSLLHILNTGNINISTLEDPIEYSVKGVSQVQINPKADLTFTYGLRYLLRQDPDIIMVGEIRDADTAVMSSDAAMTGHLVLTTLHTNDAAAAFIRFLEMGVEDYLIVSMINAIIAQRLVKKVCEECKVEERLDPDIYKKLIGRKDVVQALEARERGLSENIKDRTVYKGKGCESCLQTGYWGRLGIFEILEPNKKMHELVMGDQATAESIKASAMEDGFEDMVTDGVKKVLQGLTTFEEILRVTKNNDQ